MTCAQPVSGAAADSGANVRIPLGIADFLPLYREKFLLNSLRRRRRLNSFGCLLRRSRPGSAGLGHGLPWPGSSSLIVTRMESHSCIVASTNPVIMSYFEICA
jgi:hypothetical protein